MTAGWGAQQPRLVSHEARGSYRISPDVAAGSTIPNF
jgi:hypothetical protein